MFLVSFRAMVASTGLGNTGETPMILWLGDVRWR
jgi:hypothetical protein